VPLTDNYPHGVVFICKQDDDGTIQPCGTGFALAVKNPYGASLYLVTANHVVMDGKPTWARIPSRAPDEPPRDAAITEDWLPHPTSDVAIVPFDHMTSELMPYAAWEALLIDKRRAEVDPKLGDIIYFIGLLTDAPRMAERGIPMVRSGRIGALYQEHVPMIHGPSWNPTHRWEPIAHLMDTFSRIGFSGSPCFVEQLTINADERTGGWAASSKLALLGVVVGHFGSPGNNEGVAVVVPAEAIRELLDDERMVKMRADKDNSDKARREEKVWEKAAHADAAKVGGESEYDRFEQLTRNLVNTRKPADQDDA
jgi:hypothetical protein